MFSKTDAVLHDLWQNETEQALEKFIRVPSLSPMFDSRWEEHGYLRRAVDEAQEFGKFLVPDIRYTVLSEPGKTPLLFFEVPASEGCPKSGSVLFYGHLDKQPEGGSWTCGRAPFCPKKEGAVLYGRGAADDGYSFYSAVSLVQALRKGRIAHPRFVGIFETCEESGSTDFAYWIDCLKKELQDVRLALILDAGCLDYKRLCITTNFRGVLTATLKVSVLKHGVHSGTASGIVPDSFMIARQLLERLEESATGTIRDSAFYATIPQERLEQIRAKAALSASFAGDFPWIDSPAPRFKDAEKAILAQTWMPQLAITGAQGLPDISCAGNVLRSYTALRLSLRLPPRVDATVAAQTLKRILLSDPPFGARTELTDISSFAGWDAPREEPWLQHSIEKAGQSVFGQSAVYSGEGGSLSIFDILEPACPQAQFLLTGVLGPNSNAHGPDEALHLDYVEALCRALARVIADMP